MSPFFNCFNKNEYNNSEKRGDKMLDNFSDYEKSMVVELYNRILGSNKNLQINYIKNKINLKKKKTNISMSTEELINYFSFKTFSEKKTIYFYIVYLVLSLNEQTTTQYELLEKMRNSYLISQNKKRILYKLAYEKIDFEEKIELNLK